MEEIKDTIVEVVENVETDSEAVNAGKAIVNIVAYFLVAGAAVYAGERAMACIVDFVEDVPEKVKAIYQESKKNLEEQKKKRQENKKAK